MRHEQLAYEAERGQTSILPQTRHIQEYFPRSFIFYRPKDVVSGDFPWFFQKEGISYIAAVDCTGHGVPGALISFIGYFLLNNIVNAQTDYTAAQSWKNYTNRYVPPSNRTRKAPWVGTVWTWPY